MASPPHQRYIGIWKFIKVWSGDHSLRFYEKDLDDIPDVIKDAMEIVGVKRIEEVLEIVLV